MLAPTELALSPGQLNRGSVNCRKSLPLVVLLAISMAEVAFGAGIPVFIFAGQSEAINSGTDTGLMPPDALTPQPNVLFYNARTHTPATGAVHWVTYRPPTGPGYRDCGHTNAQGSFGPEITAANLISRKCYGGGLVGVFKYAVGATDLCNQWNPNRPGYYPDMLRCLSNAMAALPQETRHTGRVAGVFWTQGESDALAGTNDGRCLRHQPPELRGGPAPSLWPAAAAVRLWPHSPSMAE